MQHRVLSVGLDPFLLGIRNQLFSRAGYAVYSTHDCSKALAFACLCDVAVLGHTIPFEQRAELASHLHAAYPELPIIALYSPTDRKSIQCATYSLYGLQPQELLNALADSLKARNAIAWKIC